MELRVKVAELCGWTEIMHWSNGYVNGTAPFDSRLDDLQRSMAVPDYPNDLNACHEFEEELTPEQLDHYNDHLCRIVERDRKASVFNKSSDYYWHATAEQRCRAFVATMEGTKR